MKVSTYAYPKSCVRQYMQVHVPTDATYANCRTLLTMLLLSTAVNIFLSRFLKQELRFFFLFQQIESALLKGYIALFVVTSFMVFLSIDISSFYLQYNTPALYWNTATANALQPIFYSFQLTLTLTPVSVFIYIP